MSVIKQFSHTTPTSPTAPLSSLHPWSPLPGGRKWAVCRALHFAQPQALSARLQPKSQPLPTTLNLTPCRTVLCASPVPLEQKLDFYSYFQTISLRENILVSVAKAGFMGMQPAQWCRVPTSTCRRGPIALRVQCSVVAVWKFLRILSLIM